MRLLRLAFLPWLFGLSRGLLGSAPLEVSSEGTQLISADAKSSARFLGRSALQMVVDAEGKAEEAKFLEHMDLCQGKRYSWIGMINQKCNKEFGKTSEWDKQRKPYCDSGFKNCVTHYYVECCTRPEGANFLGTYCESSPKIAASDPACEVQRKIAVVKAKLNQIPTVANSLVAAKPRSKMSDRETWNNRVFDTASDVAKETNDPDESGSDAEFGRGPAPSPMVSRKNFGVGREQKGSDANEREFDEVSPSVPPEENSPSISPGSINPAPAPMPGPFPAPAPSIILPPPGLVPRLPREVHCLEFMSLMEIIQEQMRSLEDWRHGQQQAHPFDFQSVANQNPALMRYVSTLLKIGDTLRNRTNPCDAPLSGGNGNDYGSGPVNSDDDSSPSKSQGSNNVSRKDAGGKKIVHQPETAIETTMNWYVIHFQGDMNGAMTAIETLVHPHGDKWWRYRYEYTLVEALFLLPLFWALILLQRAFNAAGNRVGIGLQSDWQYANLNFIPMYRYFILPFTYNGCAISLIVFAFWGTHNATSLFDAWADFVRSQWERCRQEYGRDLCVFENIPFNGNSYYVQLTSITMKLLGACMLYAVFVWGLIRLYVSYSLDMRELERSDGGEPSPGAAKEAGEYACLQEAFCKRLETCDGYRNSERLMQAAEKIGLKLDGHLTKDELDRVQFYQYLVVALDSSLYHIVIWSWPLLGVMTLWCFLIAMLAKVFKMSLVWFLFPILLVFFLMFVSALAIKGRLWRSVTNVSLEAPMPWLSMNMWTTSFQVVLFMLCYSCSRLIFSAHIWAEFFWLGVAALTGFVLLFLLTWFWLGGLMKQMVSMLSLPPNVGLEEMQRFLENMPAARSGTQGQV